VPNDRTRLALDLKYKFATDGLRIGVSAQANGPFTTLAEVGGESDWRTYTVDLAAYAGSSVYVRLEYTVGSYYSDGGVWIDTISTEEVTNPEVEGQPIHTTTVSSLSPGTYVLAGQVVRTDAEATPVGPPMTLTVNALPQYQVEFLVGDYATRSGGGALVQMVTQGEDAVPPTLDMDPGWSFTGWSGAYTNVQAPLTLSVEAEALLAEQGTPYWWLIENNLATPSSTPAEMNTAEMSDPMGKGYPSATDYLAGTDPNNASDVLAFSQADMGATQIDFAWTGKAGRWYQLMYTASLTPADWNALQTFECTTDGQTFSHSLTPPGTVGFYCISVTLENPNP
jgi:hypothetical protein